MGERGTEPKGGGKGDRGTEPKGREGGQEDRSMREQGISLVMSSFSSEIEDYSIQEATPPHSSFLPSLSPFNLLLSLFLLF